MKYIILNLLSLFFLVNCKSVKDENVIGSYIYNSKIGSEEIHLSDNKLFSYKCQIPLIKSESKGHWEIKNNILILKSFEEFKNDYFEVVELNQNLDSTIIKVVDENDNPLAGVNIRIDNFSDNLVTDLSGHIVNENINFSKDLSIKIFSIDLSLGKNEYIVKSNSTKSLIIKIYRKTNEKRYFSNDTLKLKKNKLIFKDIAFKKVRN